MSEPFRLRATRRAHRLFLRGLSKSFPFLERQGVHVTPVNFDQPLPDTGRLDGSIWDSTSELAGLAMRDQAQLDLLAEFSSAYKQEYVSLPRHATGDAFQYYLDNDSFVAVDGEVLYSMVRHLKPSRIIEAGSGFTTLLIAQALRANERQQASECDYIAYDPYPTPVVRQGPQGLSTLDETPIEHVPLEKFEALGNGDILFIDSSHVLRIGSDVQYLFLEVLPRLAPGVHVHVHDIFMPAEYPKDWVLRERRFWNEQYLLQAFLAFNSAWEIVWAGSYMHLVHSDAVADAFPSYGPTTMPGSFWMRRRATGAPEGSMR